ncbi:flagellar hook-length control protein FliK [Rhodanobacter sp. Col0626]|uniref:flagellar hook-length control protein FliK n=1 Tax=Rhodanobacter sp. Col0626 TaxID=3415679 RepID=UPI003CECFC65
MTIPPVVSRAAAPAAPRAASAIDSSDGSNAADHFDRQLHEARQHSAVKDTDHSPKEPERPEHASTSRKPQRQPSDESSDKSPVVAGQPASRSVPTSPSTISEKTPDTTATIAVAPKDEDEPDGEAASALTGAMLALLGPAAAGVLRPAAVAGAAGALSAGKTAASDAKAADLLQLGDASGAVTALVSAALATGKTPVTGDPDLLPPIGIGKDPSKAMASTVMLSAPPAPATSATPVHSLQLPSPPGTQAFNQDLGQQVAWLSGQNVKQARIRLHPEDLGSLDVSVSVTHGRVDVVFSAQHPAAVTAVQQTLPQLDHMLAQHGLSLGHAEVGQHDRGNGHGRAGHAMADPLDEIGDSHGSGLAVTLGSVGLLDAFA